LERGEQLENQTEKSVSLRIKMAKYKTFNGTFEIQETGEISDPDGVGTGGHASW
jgi:hypothetical protein